jgi:hypothetical protein
MSNNNMKTRVWNKPTVQKALLSLRSCKNSKNQKLFEVVKKSTGFYEVRSINKKQLVFSALIGSMGYLVRFDERLFIKQ